MGFFDSLMGGIAAPIAGVFGGPAAAMGVGAFTSAYQQDKANRQNQANWNQQMRWEEHMSSTAHQRQVNDMRAAGLNPILSAGGGASTPSTSPIPIESTMSGVASSALDALRLKKEVKAVDSQIGLNESQKETQDELRKVYRGNAKLAAIEADKATLEMPAVAAEAKLRKGQADIDSRADMLAIDAFLRRFGAGASAVNQLRSRGVNINRGTGGPAQNPSSGSRNIP